MPSPLGILVADPKVRALLATLGTPYHWGRGSPATQWPPGPCDCSGFAQAALVMLGLLRSSEPDRTALALANASSPVASKDARLGDLAFYGNPVSHVMVCLGAGWVIGPRGGGSATTGNDSRAFVDLKPLVYRDDFVVVGRLKPEFSPAK
jgi:cell wall-associated NlpC family hydrolase